MKEPVIVGLNTLDLRARAARPGPDVVDVAVRAHKKRVFTEDEWNFLNTCPTLDLQHRIRQGDLLIGLLSRPEMLNMTADRANEISSNLRFQQDAIGDIIKHRGA